MIYGRRPRLSEPRPPVRLESEPPFMWSTASMAPRANWKGFLRLSLVTCPIALYPATSESEKISFNQLNRKTGHRIKYAKVDSDTGEELVCAYFLRERNGLQESSRTC